MLIRLAREHIEVGSTADRFVAVQTGALAALPFQLALTLGMEFEGPRGHAERRAAVRAQYC